MEKKLLSVTDLTSYLYCPRKFYITRILGLREPATKQMIEGGIRHKVLEEFSKHEEKVVESFHTKEEKEFIIKRFKSLLEILNQKVFTRNFSQIKKFNIPLNELAKKINQSMKSEIELRAESIEKTMQKGFLGKQLLEKLTPKYISEMTLVSESLGLKGRADRVMIIHDDKTIIPFELKTREAEKIWDSDEIQLTAYTMLLEEKFQKTIPLAILESGNKKHELIITPDLKQKVRDLIKEIRELYKSAESGQEKPAPKFPSNFSKCQTCFWDEHCREM